MAEQLSVIPVIVKLFFNNWEVMTLLGDLHNLPIKWNKFNAGPYTLVPVEEYHGKVSG